ncbi:hypothetical protein NMY22_g13117 [Coprinellus aureogranulatus]|nr:hypothetical protein NMY22_g13117 [Coprinellus aureogranulatus]
MVTLSFSLFVTFALGFANIAPLVGAAPSQPQLGASIEGRGVGTPEELILESRNSAAGASVEGQAFPYTSSKPAGLTRSWILVRGETGANIMPWGEEDPVKKRREEENGAQPWGRLSSGTEERREVLKGAQPWGFASAEGRDTD